MTYYLFVIGLSSSFPLFHRFYFILRCVYIFISFKDFGTKQPTTRSRLLYLDFLIISNCRVAIAMRDREEAFLPERGVGGSALTASLAVGFVVDSLSHVVRTG